MQHSTTPAPFCAQIAGSTRQSFPNSTLASSRRSPTVSPTSLANSHGRVSPPGRLHNPVHMDSLTLDGARTGAGPAAAASPPRSRFATLQTQRQPLQPQQDPHVPLHRSPMSQAGPRVPERGRLRQVHPLGPRHRSRSPGPPNHLLALSGVGHRDDAALGRKAPAAQPAGSYPLGDLQIRWADTLGTGSPGFAPSRKKSSSSPVKRRDRSRTPGGRLAPPGKAAFSAVGRAADIHAADAVG